MSDRIVIKIGGSVLKTQDDLARVRDIIASYNGPVIVVVSAFSGVTSELAEAVEKAKTSEKFIDAYIASLSEKHVKLLEPFIKSSDGALKTLLILESRTRELTRLLKGIHYIGDAPPFVYDSVLAYGERFSSLIVSSVLEESGIVADEILPEDIGLITDGEPLNATVDMDASAEKVSRKLEAGRCWVIPGFYGISMQGKVTLLGRGGSDYSAAAIARCVEARCLDFWKDCDGFLSADPSLIKSSSRIPQLHYDEAAELSYFGAKILHPRTVEPLRDKEIPIRIFSSASAFPCEPITVVDGFRTVGSSMIKSVTHTDEFCILRLSGPGLGLKQGVLARVTGKLNESGININSVVTSQTAINLLISHSDLSGAFRALAGENIVTINEITAVNDVSTIAVVGNGLLDNFGIASKIFTSLSEKKINVELISFGASHVVIYFAVKKSSRKEAITAIHKTFFENQNKQI